MIGLKVEQELKEFLQEMADSENRSLSNFVLNAILTYIKDHKGVEWTKKGTRGEKGINWKEPLKKTKSENNIFGRSP
ncbi:MAG: hypothetical protein JRH18_20000 [Deltaproteobacteria bacterium]|nr:hypothetical protein [Deltaproteobacteria bacterium]MBW2153935.1 hypothetical protein [Deltaproteobacteria bacterium]